VNSGGDAQAVSMPGVDPHWFEDYRQACSEISYLYGAAFKTLEVELGEATALALAPVLLPRVVAAAEQEAGMLAQNRAMKRQEQWEEERLRAFQQQQLQSAQVRQQQPENPW
jgi:hypothetical protein